MPTAKFVPTYILALSTFFLCNLSLRAAENPSPSPKVNHATAFASGHVTGQSSPAQSAFTLGNPVRQVPKRATGSAVDSVEQHSTEPSAEFNLIYHVLGLGNGFPDYTVSGNPPNATLAVGSSEVVQAASIVYADFNKSTGAIIPLNGVNFVPGNTIFAQLLPGTLCANNNDGNITVKFDRDAQRWIVAQDALSSPYAVCVAVSQTATFSDNLWNAYQFPTVQSGLPDYPKWGIWSSGGQSDGYYQNWNNFGPDGSGFVGPVMCGYDRSKMLVGDPGAEQICFQLDQTEDSLLPADRDSPARPPVNEDEFFIGSVDAVDNSHLSLYSMHIVDWSTGQATMTGLGNSQLIAVAPYTGSCDGEFGGDCVPQGGGSNRLQSLGDRLMYRFAYWHDQPPNIATATPPLPAPVQHWLVNFDVWNAATSAIGVRWMEFQASFGQVPVTSLSVFQQGTYVGTTGDSNYRWMGSIARDNVLDILAGYSESSSMLHPSIAVAGRVFTDPRGTLSPEVFSVSGSGSQEASPWGQYSTMAVDPVDNCTFFFTTEYYMVTAVSDWSTDISSWKFPNCH